MRLHPRGLVALLLATAVCASASAQGAWIFRSSATNPAANSPAMSFDSSRSLSFVLVNNAAVNDVETWSWNGTFWLPYLPANKPLTRTHSTLVYDANRDKHVLIMGLGTTFPGAFSEVWEWDGTNWNFIASNIPPPRRGDHGAVYDPAKQKILMFGGFDGDNNPAYFSDTWEYDGTNWVQLSPVSSPGPRRGCAMAYDSTRNRTVLFGGSRDNSYFDDTWEWDGTNWFQRFPVNSPSARTGASMAYDPGRGVTLLFGGDGGGALPNGDTWEWNGTDWERLTPSSIPASRHDGGMVYDTTRGTAVLFGGTNGSYLRDTWEYTPGVFASFSTFGAGCPGSRGTPFLSTPLGPPVQGQSFTVLVNNVPMTSQVWMFYGSSNSAWGQTPLPFEMSGINAPGCSILTNGAVALPVANVVGVGVSTIQLPIGLPPGFAFFNQAFVTDSANPLGLVVSDAACVIVGS